MHNELGGGSLWFALISFALYGLAEYFRFYRVWAAPLRCASVSLRAL